jgi:hypothetical protein
LVALANFMRLSLQKGAHAALSSAAWQEIRVRSGRDDNSVVDLTVFLSTRDATTSLQQNCRLDRSAA